MLRQKRHRSFQQLADNAFADFLAKNHHPADLKSQLKESAGKMPSKKPKITPRGPSRGAMGPCGIQVGEWI